MTTIADRYELADRIGSGAMGDVYRADDTLTGATVAVKHLKPDLLRHDPDLLTRFQREGQALRDLNHPNIVSLLNVVSENDAHYLIVEYIPGGDLAILLTDHPQGLAIEVALNIALDLADALTRAHRLDIIHRDLKPANVLIAEDGTPRLSDFGIALHNSGERLTDSNAIIGTVDYIAPEAINGRPIDTRADVWSFGVMLFEMLAGHRPFRGDTLVSLFAGILTEPVPDLEALRPDCPIGLVDLVYRMLVKDPQGRIPSVRHVGAALEDIAQGRTPEHQESLFDTPIPAEPPRSHLPIASTPFVGRKAELEAISSQMQECRLLTLLGPGGMGKSRLGIEAAAQLADHYARGAHFVALAPIATPNQIAPAVAEAVDFQFHGGTDPEQQMLDFLREKEMLLLLDNFEHVLGGAAFVSAILDRAPQVRILVTSRERLNLTAECVFDVHGMQTPHSGEDLIIDDFEAVAMFMTYARRVQSDYSLSDEAKAVVAQLCELVDGMPLAIELAAGWTRSLSPQEIVEELQTDLDFLSTEISDVPERQRSMRAAFNYSWRLLTDVEKDAFMKFSVFRGGAAREGARAVTGASLRTLSALVDKSMLRRDTATGRFEVHELMRQFAEQMLAESPHYAPTRDAHSAYFARYLTDREPLLRSALIREAINEITIELENIWAMWDWAVSQRKYDDLSAAVEGLFTFHQRSDLLLSPFKAVLQQLEQDLRSEDVPAGLRGKILWRQAAHSDLETGEDKTRGERHINRALDLLRSAGERREEAQALLKLAQIMSRQHEAHEEAVALSKSALAIFEELDDRQRVADALHNIANLMFWGLLGTLEERQSLHLRAIAAFKEVDDPFGEASALETFVFGDAYGDEDLDMAERCLKIYQDIDSRHGQSMALSRLAWSNIMIGRVQEARVLMQERVVLCEEVGDPNEITDAYQEIGLLALDELDLEQAEHYSVLSLEMAREAGNRILTAFCVWQLAQIAFERGGYEEASAKSHEMLQIITRDHIFAWFAIVLLARVAAVEGDWPSATTLFIEAVEKSESFPFRQIETTTYVAELASLRGSFERSTVLASFRRSYRSQEQGVMPTYIVARQRRVIERVFDRAQEALPSETFAAALELGEALDLDTIIQQILNQDLKV